MRLYSFLCCLVIFLLVSTPAQAVDDSTNAVDLAIEQLKEHAVAGDTEAFEALRTSLESSASVELLYKLGRLYQDMPTAYILHVEDEATAEVYFDKALAMAQQEDDWKWQAQHAKAKAILKRHETKPDAPEIYDAVALLAHASDPHFSPAALTYADALAMLLQYDAKQPGNILPPELTVEKAESLYRFALSEEKGDAALGLAALYKDKLLPYNPQEEQKWIALGITMLEADAAGGEHKAALKLAKLYRDGGLVEPNPQEALRWFEVAAELNSPSGRYETAVRYADVGAAWHNAEKAYTHLTVSANQGYVPSALALASSLTGAFSVLHIPEEEAHMWAERLEGIGNPDIYRLMARYHSLRDEYDTAERYLRNLADEQQDPEAMLQLYMLYSKPDTSLYDQALAQDYLQQALDSGKLAMTPEDRTELAQTLLASGVNDPVALQKAIALLEVSAEAGHSYAMLLLAEQYAQGNGVAQDRALAKKWLETAEAKATEPDSLKRIADYYREGDVVTKDLEKALTYYSKAAAVGETDGQYQLGYMAVMGAMPDLSPEEGMILLRQAASTGHGKALLTLGNAYMGAYGHAPSYPTRAARYFQQAAAQNMPDAQVQLATLYMEGRGVKKDAVKALEWLNRAKEGGYAPALLALAKYYHPAWGVRPDERQWRDWLEKAVEHHVSDAAYYLARGYLEGEYFPQNKEKAVAYLKQAAMHNHHASRQALRQLGVAIPKNAEEQDEDDTADISGEDE